MKRPNPDPTQEEASKVARSDGDPSAAAPQAPQAPPQGDVSASGEAASAAAAAVAVSVSPGPAPISPGTAAISSPAMEAMARAALLAQAGVPSTTDSSTKPASLSCSDALIRIPSLVSVVCCLPMYVCVCVCQEGVCGERADARDGDADKAVLQHHTRLTAAKQTTWRSGDGGVPERCEAVCLHRTPFHRGGQFHHLPRRTQHDGVFAEAASSAGLQRHPRAGPAATGDCSEGRRLCGCWGQAALVYRGQPGDSVHVGGGQPQQGLHRRPPTQPLGAKRQGDAAEVRPSQGLPPRQGA
mmetsp:Transcript_34080/g.84295  ORF Transcript_34080/g.84295 Transcript_34080/m.84295 type:complete len:298 (+) Transcript_34080:67-960(+)